MYELNKVGNRTYYIDSPSKVGLFLMDDQKVCLIDSGNDKEAGKRIQKILEEQGWELSMIINTHSHADHIGGNNILQQRLGVPAFSQGADMALIQYPILEPSGLYGGYPPKELRNKFLMAQPSLIQELTPEILPKGLEMTRLDGHSFSMIGLKTEDQVWFLADCLNSEEVMEKYPVFFLYDVASHLETLSRVEALKGDLFISSHVEPLKEVKHLVEKNRSKMLEIMEKITSICSQPTSLEELLKQIFDDYGLKMNFSQHVLVGNTIKSYLSYMVERGEVQVEFCENRMLWKSL
jgi:glyoxylase-like metal-dependent hydrolase (beta-lactamase superfamily II)